MEFTVKNMVLSVTLNDLEAFSFIKEKEKHEDRNHWLWNDG